MAGVWTYLLAVLVMATGTISGTGTYFLSYPKMITRGSTFGIAVNILNGTSVNVTAILQEKVYNGNRNRYEISNLKNASATFTKGQKGSLEIPIEDKFKCRQCQLMVQGRGSQVFERTASVNLKTKVVSIFIQTDKAIYKPGQKVRYRAFAVYPNLQIYRGSFTVIIKDPSLHKLVMNTGLRTESGVIEGSLNLSDFPPYGDWSIRVKAEELSEVETQYFTVEEYELPRFEVTVDLSPFALLSEARLSGTIKAKYTYGKPVKGLVELMVGPGGLDGCGKMRKSVNVALEIDGEVPFSVPKSSIQRVMSIYDKTSVQVTAIVKETATGVRLNGSNTVQYHSEEFSVSFMTNTPNVFKPGLPYTAYVQVKSPDAMPPPVNEANKLIVYPYAEYRVQIGNQNKYGITAFTGSYPLQNMTLPIPANGIIPVNIQIPNNATNIVMQAYYKNLFARKSVEKSHSRSNNYMQLTLKDSNIKSGDSASFQLQATEPLDQVYYEIIARGGIQKTGTLSCGMKSTFSFDLELTSSMAPVANLLTYYIRKNSEIVADSIAFNIDGVFENQVGVEFSTEKVEPHTDIQLKVSADPKSQVFLLAVDQSVLLLKSGNDIDSKKVSNGISDQKPLDSEYALSQSAGNIGQVFSKSGLSYITDAIIEPVLIPRRVNMWQSRRRPAYSGVPAFAFDSDMDFPSGVSAVTVKKVDRIRKKFPEAWLWMDTSVLADGTVNINTTVPDTITTWIASAFATNMESGLGVAASKANVTVFRSFFVSLTYPSAVKRNEKAVIQATVFNYLPSDTTVIVSMKEVNGFQGIQVLDDGSEVMLEGTQPQRIRVGSNSEGVVYFPVLAKEIGVFDIEVKAQSPLAADGVRRQIIIEPEGAPVSMSTQIYIEQKKEAAMFSNSYLYSFPESTITGSERVSVGVSGDLIGPSLENFDRLLSIPMGCGEQNMVKFVPLLYMAKYLQTIGQTPDDNIVDALASGYQRQLSYIRSDGSFSAFGNNDQSGSTWLTAQVSRTLNEARQFIYVDPDLLIKTVDWIVDRQRQDGSFVELGRVIDPNTMGKHSGPSLTAFCLMSLVQNKEFISRSKCKKSKINCHRTEKWMNATQKAIDYLENSFNSISDDPFPMSVVTYALNKAKSSRAFRSFRKLKRKITSKGGFMYLKDKAKTSSTLAPRYNIIWDPSSHHSRPVDILSTSYAILTYTVRNQVKQALPLIKWLVNKRNPMGGFSSTQDTTVALQALSAFAEKSTHPSTDLKLTFSGTDEVLDFTVDQNNLLTFQRQEFKVSAVEGNKINFPVEVNAYGNGFALAEIVYNFHTSEVVESTAFDVSTVLLDDDLDKFNLMICTKWLKEGKSGMVVQEIEIPSGFEPDLTSIGNVADMKRYERKGTIAAVYFDEIGKTSTCYSILMTRKAKVAQSEKSSVHTISYYNPVDESTVFYQPIKLRDSKIIDVCPKC